jgi:hypothetical protein
VALRTYVAISRFARSRVTEATAMAPQEADATYEVRGNWDLRAIRALWRIPQFRGDKKGDVEGGENLAGSCGSWIATPNFTCEYHSFKVGVTSLPACRETLRGEKKERYFDFTHLELHTKL